MIKVKRKPIIQVKGSGKYNYKYCHIAYATGVPIDFETDLTKEQFDILIDGGYSEKQIDCFERLGYL